MTKAQQQKFLKLVQGLNDLLVDIRKNTPNANYYLAEDSLHILSDESHDDDDHYERMRQDRSMIMMRLLHSGGGDW